MDDGSDIGSGREYIAMKPPFARRTAAAEPAAVSVHERNIVGFEGVIRHSGRTHEKTPLIPAYADIAGCAIGQAALHERAASGNHRFAQLFVRHCGAGIAHRRSCRWE